MWKQKLQGVTSKIPLPFQWTGVRKIFWSYHNTFIPRCLRNGFCQKFKVFHIHFQSKSKLFQVKTVYTLSSNSYQNCQYFVAITWSNYRSRCENQEVVYDGQHHWRQSRNDDSPSIIWWWRTRNKEAEKLYNCCWKNFTVNFCANCNIINESY